MQKGVLKGKSTIKPHHHFLGVDNWIKKLWDPFGIIKLLEKMYLPWVYLFLGDASALHYLLNPQQKYT